MTADYELSVTIYSYNNPENKCASCRDGILEAFGCCDNHALKNASECGIRTRTCEIVLSVCLRQPSNRYGDALCPNGNSLFKSDILQVTSFSPPLNISSKTVSFACNVLGVCLPIKYSCSCPERGHSSILYYKAPEQQQEEKHNGIYIDYIVPNSPNLIMH